MSSDALRMAAETVMRGEACLFERETRVQTSFLLDERMDHNSRGRDVEISITVSPGRPEPHECRYMMLLVQGLDQRRVFVTRARENYEMRRSGFTSLDLEMYTDYDFADSLDQELRNARAPTRREDREFRREYQAQPIPARARAVPRANVVVRYDRPGDSGILDDCVDALRYAMRSQYLDTVSGRDLDRLAESLGIVRNGETDASVRSRTGALRNEPAIARKCIPGDPSTHEWVDAFNEGPTARRCSGCGRVTGQFWSPDDYQRAVEWLVTVIKSCVLLWTQTIDASALRFSLIELESGKTVVSSEENDNDDDAVKRFALLEI